MSDGNVMNLKIFLKGDNGVDEVRRITVDASVATSYLFMKEKLQTVFPMLRNSSFKITWKDIDDDVITIASDEDFITAFTEMNDNVKVLTVNVMHRTTESGIYLCAPPEEPPKPLIVCDGCDRKITGFRYKCLQCPDYDLCANCEFQGCHFNHVMVRLPQNETYSPRCARKFMHHIARNLKKSAHCASKEAHRAAKHAAKYASKCRQTDSSAEEDNQPPTCPFTAKNVHELGSLAQQTLAEIFKPTTSSTGCQANEEKDQGTMLMDALRNVVDGFFGHSTANAAPTQPQPETSTKPASENQLAPMETEVSPSAPLYPILDKNIPKSTPVGSDSPSMATAGSSTPPQVTNRNPEWTFVASNGSVDNSGNANVQDSRPTVAFIYHENPVIAEGLVKLHEMGFSNETGVLSNLLEHFNGNVNDVVKAIFDRNI